MTGRPESTRGSQTAAATREALVVGGLGLALMCVGLTVVDRPFYEHVSLKINTGNPVADDLYQRGRMFWFVARASVYVVGAAVVWLYVLAAPRRRWPSAAAAVITVALVALVANLLQAGIGRARPNASESGSHLEFHTPFVGLWRDAPDGLPSGEAASAFAIAFVAARLLGGPGRWVYAAALLAAAARWLPGMHYLSDVTAGAAVAVLLAAFVYPRLRRRLSAAGHTPPPG